jgi:hypothetical protein
VDQDMSAFKHVVVPIGVVLGLGVARVVVHVAQYVQKRDRVRFSATHVVWSVTLLLLFVGLWWNLWGLRAIHAGTWSFFTLIYLLTGPILLYVPSILALPEVPDSGELDLTSLFERVGRPILLFVAAYIVWLASIQITLLEESVFAPQRAIEGAAVIVLLIAALFPNRRMVAASGVIVLLLLVLGMSTVKAQLS